MAQGTPHHDKQALEAAADDILEGTEPGAPPGDTSGLRPTGPGGPTRAADRRMGPTQRAGLLVAISGPYHDRVQRELSRIPFGSVIMAGAISSFRMGMTTGPMRAMQEVLGATKGTPTTPEEVAQQRRLMMAGSAATVAAGVLAQRRLNHGGRRGPGAELGRVLGSQLAIGGAANAIVLGTDHLLRTETMRTMSRRGAAAAVGTVVVLAQRKALKTAARRLTLPTPAHSAVIAVPGRLGTTRHVTVPIRY